MWKNAWWESPKRKPEFVPRKNKKPKPPPPNYLDCLGGINDLSIWDLKGFLWFKN